MGLLALTAVAPGLSFTTEVRSLLGGISDTDRMPDTRIWRFVQDAYDFVAQPYAMKHGGVFCHPELEHTEDLAIIAGQSQVTSTVWNSLRSVQIIEAAPGAITTSTTRYPLYWWDVAQSDLVNPTPGRPGYYAWWSNTFVFDCAPLTSMIGQTLRVRGFRQPVFLDTTNPTLATTVLRREWDTIICKGAEYFGWMWRGETDRAQFAKEEFARLINEQIQHQAASMVEAPGGVVQVSQYNYMKGR